MPTLDSSKAADSKLDFSGVHSAALKSTVAVVETSIVQGAPAKQSASRKATLSVNRKNIEIENNLLIAFDIACADWHVTALTLKEIFHK